MKVRIQPGDQKAVGHYRLMYPAVCSGVDTYQGKSGLVVAGISPSTRRRFAMPGIFDADVIVLQRPSNPTLVQMIPAFQQRGHAIVVDVDDDLHSIHHANRARGSEDPRMVLKACALADLVTVSTPALAKRYGAHGRVRVLPNCVPEALLDMPRDTDGRTVGWAGWVGTHPEDLQATRGGVQEALRDMGARFKTIGPGDGVKKALSLAEEPEATGGLPMPDYYIALGSLDVGICPLQDSAFNAAKSRLKVLEMAARGAAVIASNRNDYARVACEAICHVAADRARSWRALVTQRLSSDTLRSALVAEAQDAIRKRHTYETQGWRWGEAWAEALDNHRAQTRKVAA